MTFGSLFAGIGGMDLGLERAGMACKWQVEIDPYASRVLARHWPDVRRHDDVRTFPPDGGAGWQVDLIAGGFPCQDISEANHNGVGIAGARSGLWAEFERAVRVLRPRYVLVENVRKLRSRGLGRVLGDLASLGFDAEWSVLPACALGSPHPRERLFVVAHAQGERPALRQAPAELPGGPSGGRDRGDRRDWLARSGLRGIAHGVPDRVDRLERVGNAVVPRVAEWIGRRILDSVNDEATR